MGLRKVTERRGKLVAEAERLEDGLFGKRVSLLMEKGNRRKLWEQAEGRFVDLFQSWTGDRRAASLGVCYRETDLARHRYGYYMILYDEDFYLDQNPVRRVWIPEGFAEYYEKDMEYIMDALKDDHVRLSAYEEDAVRRRIVEYYHALASVLCREWAGDLFSMKGYVDLPKTDEFFLFFGRYRREGEILMRESNRELNRDTKREEATGES